MMYLSKMLGVPILDANGQQLGGVADLAISTDEMFPRVVALAYIDANQTLSLLSWQRYVDRAEEDAICLSAASDALEFSFLQEDELLLNRDLMQQQIVDVQSKKVVLVSDLKLSDSGKTLRLLGALVAPQRRGLARLFGGGKAATTADEQLIAWNYIDLPGRDFSQLKLSMNHKRLHELHPADVADIIEQLDPAARAAVFSHLDKEQAAEAISELEEEYQAELIEDLPEEHAADLLAEMDPDDAADIIADLEPAHAERLLRLMGYEDSEVIRSLLGYSKNTAGGIMTPEVAVATADMTVAETITSLRRFARDAADLHYVYLVDDTDEDGKPAARSHLSGVVTLFKLLTHDDDTALGDFATTELITAQPEDDQEDVAELISKYNLLALPVIDAGGHLLGTVTVDDAFDVMEEEAEEDLARATGRTPDSPLPGSPGDSRLHRVTRGLRWFFPQSVSWVAIWVVFSCLVSYVTIQIALRDTGLATSVGFTTLAQAANVLFGFITVLPLALTTLRSAVLKAIETLTDREPDERPTPARRFLIALAIGAGSALIISVIIELFVCTQQLQILDWISMAMICASLLVTSVLTALFTMVLVNRAVAADDAGRDISPRRTAAFGMLIYTVLLIISTILVCYNAILLFG